MGTRSTIETSCENVLAIHRQETEREIGHNFEFQVPAEVPLNLNATPRNRADVGRLRNLHLSGRDNDAAGELQDLGRGHRPIAAIPARSKLLEGVHGTQGVAHPRRGVAAGNDNLLPLQAQVWYWPPPV